MDRDEFSQLAQKTRRAVNHTTWHSISLWIARLVLCAFGTLWFRNFLMWIKPELVPVVNGRYVLDSGVLINGTFDVFLAFALAAACTTVPSIFLAGLIPNSPANTLLSGLDYKYGRPGYYFALIGAFMFSLLGMLVLWDYWISRPGLLLTPETIATAPLMKKVMPGILTAVSLMLMVGFPGWALNRMTPDQWVDAVMQARQVARIKRLLDLEDMAEKAIIARARTLLYMDISKLTLEQRAANNREVAAILAAAERGMANSLKQVAGTFKSLYKMELATAMEEDPEIHGRYRALVDHFDMAQKEADRYANYGEGFAADVEAAVEDDMPPVRATASDREREDRPRATVVHSDAETSDREREDGGPLRSATARDERPRSTAMVVATKVNEADLQHELIAIARQHNAALWKRSQIEDTCSVEKTRALDIIKALQGRGWAVKVENTRDQYRLTDAGLEAAMSLVQAEKGGQ